MAQTPETVEIRVVPTLDREELRRHVRETLAEILEEIAVELRTEVVS